MGRVPKKDLEQYGLRTEDVFNRKKWQEQIRAQFANLASQDNDIKTKVVVVVVVVEFSNGKRLYSECIALKGKKNFLSNQFFN